MMGAAHLELARARAETDIVALMNATIDTLIQERGAARREATDLRAKLAAARGSHLASLDRIEGLLRDWRARSEAQPTPPA